MSLFVQSFRSLIGPAVLLLTSAMAVGTVGIGFLGVTTGLLYGAGPEQLVVQVAIALFAMVWSGAATLVIALVLKATMGWRVDGEVEVTGIDLDEHGERAYDFAPASFGGSRTPAMATAASTGSEGLTTKERVEA